MNNKLCIIPLGGCGEIGKNMTAIEYDDEIVVIDAGIMFPQNDMLGVDAIIQIFNGQIRQYRGHACHPRA